MDTYFNENKLAKKKSRQKQRDWMKKLEGMKIRSNIKKEIIRLARYDKKMQEAIIHGEEYTKEVTFFYLESVFMKKRAHERRKYKTLSDALAAMKITLLIK